MRSTPSLFRKNNLLKLFFLNLIVCKLLIKIILTVIAVKVEMKLKGQRID